jgi:hypothetical protein
MNMISLVIQMIIFIIIYIKRFFSIMVSTKINDLVKTIHNKDIYGVFVETGCGVPVANALFNVSGASKTVYATFSPYSDIYARQEYGIDKDVRAISKEYVHNILNKYKDIDSINTIYVASFQIGNYNDIVTHGWIALRNRGNLLIFYHVTIRKSMNRSEYIERIGEIGLTLIANENIVCVATDLDIDMVYVLDKSNNNIVPNNLMTLMLMSKDNILCFENKKPVRLEDKCRGQNNSNIKPFINNNNYDDIINKIEENDICYISRSLDADKFFTTHFP